MRTATRTAEVELDANGVVVVRIRAGVEQSFEDARQNLRAAVMAGGGLRRPILVDISRAMPLEPEVRRVYSGKLVNASFVALALVVEASPFGRAMGNVYLAIARPGMPTRLFSDEASALRWLTELVG